MRLPESIIEDIRARADLAAHVARHVELRQTGTNLRGLCPFHGEKTPSFYVHPDRQRYYCFGCKASGDIFSFLMQLEGLTFMEAVHSLAEELGIVIPTSTSGVSEDERGRRQKEGWYAVLEASAAFYEKRLRSKDASLAHEHLRERGVNQELAKTFRLGFAPSSWDDLARHLASQGFAIRDAEAMGLVSPRRGGSSSDWSGMYDRFRNRLMFPISDAQGRIVAFSGRRLIEIEDPDKGPVPKYINSPETPLYKKSDTLFGLFPSRVGLRRKGFAILCEGNFDVVKLHGAGFDVAVAPLGTAFTHGQGKLLRRYVEDLVLMFDGDAAGEKALLAAFDVVSDLGLGARVVRFPSGDDPDSFLRREGEEKLQQQMDSAPTLIEYLIDRAAEKSGADSRTRGRAIADLAPLLARVANPIERNLCIERVAKRFEIRDPKVVRGALREAYIQNRRSDTPKSYVGTPTSRSEEPDKYGTLEWHMMGAVLDQPRVVMCDDFPHIAELLTNEEVRYIFTTIQRAMTSEGEVDLEAVLRAQSGGAVESGVSGHRGSMSSWLEQRFAVPVLSSVDEALAYVKDAAFRLRKQRTEEELPRLQAQILQARNRGDNETAEVLTRRHMELFRSAVMTSSTEGSDGAQAGRDTDSLGKGGMEQR